MQLVFPNSKLLDLTQAQIHRAPVKGETFSINSTRVDPDINGQYVVNHVDWEISTKRGMLPIIYLEKAED